ncbi:GrpB family protein [Salipiger bermudensis]|nr:GrpB family protein [Salipiger bermudensis]
MHKFVVPHDPTWALSFEREVQAVNRELGTGVMDIHHIGSTSIPGILAKPIIDMLGVVSTFENVPQLIPTLLNLGYESMGAYGIDERQYFRKVDISGRRTHHLHVFAAGSVHIERHIAFREYLRKNPWIAAQYSDLKARIAAANNISRREYADAKSPFIVETEQKAVDWYRRTHINLPSQ